MVSSKERCLLLVDREEERARGGAIKFRSLLLLRSRKESKYNNVNGGSNFQSSFRRRAFSSISDGLLKDSTSLLRSPPLSSATFSSTTGGGLSTMFAILATS